MKIYAPVKDANGVYASVRFVNGVGETDNPRLIQWFETHGYTVKDTKPKSKKQVKQPNELETLLEEPEMMGYAEKISEPTSSEDFEKMTPYQLRDWLVSNGHNPGNTRNKDKLLELVREVSK